MKRSWLNSIVEVLLFVLFFPFMLVLQIIPDIYYHIHFLLTYKKAKLSRTNVIFLVNPKSGGGEGKKLFRIAKALDRGNYIFDVLKDDYINKIRQRLLEIQGDLTIVIAGGDGSQNSSIAKIEDSLSEAERDRIVYAPMGLGTGNDLSQTLGFSPRVRLNEVYRFFEKLDAHDLAIVKYDRWKLNVYAMEPQPKHKKHENPGENVKQNITSGADGY